MISYNYPKCFLIGSRGSQYWVLLYPHSIMVTYGDMYRRNAGNGSASLGIQSSCEYNVVCVVVVVVEVVEGPVYTHSLECEFSYLYLMIKGVFH